ncbi:MAG: S26 family signal peptidase [Planctomycetota bacterium]|jgi:hypothetical protein
MRQKSIQRSVRFAVLLGVVLMLGFVFRKCERFKIPDPDQSMSPVYPGGSRVVCEVIDEDDALERGMDVVYAMEWQGQLTARYGRIRALPGDRIAADAAGMLLVNGEKIGPINIRGKPMGLVPADTVFILAVNPQETLYPDSRKLGFIQRKDVRARILARWGFGG